MRPPDSDVQDTLDRFVTVKAAKHQRTDRRTDEDLLAALISFPHLSLWLPSLRQ
ncbi:hypothetical protein [Roseovarius sp. Pro17]|uniref:hypothetical protein n=1 Tax=Roseovarius sp. Pro17 TaxID=3108175 RepID=UPI002D76FE17|nr:hypothetical protein [Roseovarius sp. Pro17]